MEFNIENHSKNQPRAEGRYQGLKVDVKGWGNAWNGDGDVRCERHKEEIKRK